jgi:hypothetical protein
VSSGGGKKVDRASCWRYACLAGLVSGKAALRIACASCFTTTKATMSLRPLISAILITLALAANAQPASAQAAPAASAVAASAAALAPADPAAKFAAQKQRQLDRLARRAQFLQALQACMQSATDRAGMRACRQSARASMQKRN